MRAERGPHRGASSTRCRWTRASRRWPRRPGSTRWSSRPVAGEDYELLFTAPAGVRAAVERAGEESGSPVTWIGQVSAAASEREAVTLLDETGRPRRLAGWDHLRRGREKKGPLLDELHDDRCRDTLRIDRVGVVGDLPLQPPVLPLVLSLRPCARCAWCLASDAPVCSLSTPFRADGIRLASSGRAMRHRRSADSVPPSDPGPAYVTGPRTVTSDGASGDPRGSPPARRT